ncbi:YdiU family protein [Chitinophagaceae bacterium LB-8]|uniref:Protein nucleotidyltransferase YdiU n=1 Tax=Paraflavisolibacter caeni TaxID=2982496 RepID=A0A9X2XPE9_9BACT|nr:YdiU family protein [Paraflavisolibacter caeni]MCU7550709.1 YdiU family protein [Paraflavisolibacter caeni]
MSIGKGSIEEERKIFMKNLSEITFRNDFVENFPGDDTGSTQPRQTPGMFYSKALPTPVNKVALLAWSDELAEELELSKPASQKEIDILGGNEVTPSMYPYAACYAGHQFGNWAGQLGDGRAITLGELVTSKGQKWELQLKGAGSTAYSRMADGRAVLRSSVREYLMSEAIHHLRIPTTRALSLVSTGEPVLRDMFYDGHPAYEPGAIVMRVAPSFLRFGNFEIFAARGELDNLRKLVDWTIEKYYPHLQGQDRVISWYKEMVDRTARLMVEWMRVGFVHGVMNTDNMSILGLTIDYGPYSFVDNYDPSFTPNTTDLPGRRYAFARQAAVAKWNLGCLGGAILPLLSGEEELIKVVDSYDDVYWTAFYSMMGNKIGLDGVRPDDISLITELEKMMATVQPDMTIFYQLLSHLPAETKNKEEVLQHFGESFYQKLSQIQSDLIFNWIQRYRERKKTNTISPEESVKRMQENNPRFILRNYLLHQAIEDLEKGDDSLFVKLQQAMKEPYSAKHDEFFQKRPSWASQKAGCSMLSCSS